MTDGPASNTTQSDDKVTANDTGKGITQQDIGHVTTVNDIQDTTVRQRPSRPPPPPPPSPSRPQNKDEKDGDDSNQQLILGKICALLLSRMTLTSQYNINISAYILIRRFYGKRKCPKR